MNLINRRRQQGISSVGWLLIASIAGFFILTLFKVYPMYYEHYKIISTLNAIQEDPSVDVKSKSAIWEKMNKRFFIDNVRTIKREHVKMSRKDGKTTVSVSYEARTPYIANLSLIGSFNKTVVIDR
ncbi:MAG: DUF4845 domain-containing protein [Gammaproteobacteria bacterium]|nr:DUF4845 domain-containing protein [Gammaproteobacteria bacterium]